MNGPSGSATPFSHLRCRVRSSAVGSRSAQARRSSSPRHRRICSARTHGRWGLMREPCCSARTSSPTPSCSNGSRSGETAGHEPDERNLQLHVHVRQRVDDRDPAEPLGRLEGARRQPSGIFDRTTDRKDVQMRGHADVVPVAGSVLPASSRRLRSEVEHSAASDSDDPGPHQEGALLTVGRAFCTDLVHSSGTDQAERHGATSGRPTLR